VSNQDFINLLSQKIDNIPGFPVLKSLSIAQACLESGWGKKIFHNNVLGIKCHHSDMWAGCQIGKTSEVINGKYEHGLKLGFQAYHSIDDCLQDYANIMTNAYKYKKDRYKPVREAKNYIDATQAVKDCGYATSLAYVANLRRIIEQNKLYELDNKMEDYYITPNFKYSEFICKDGTEVPEDLKIYMEIVATELQMLRNEIDKPIIITSAYRTPAYNKKVGGKPASYHLKMQAADIRVPGMKPYDVAIYAARYTNFGGFGIANSFLHLDLRGNFTIFKY